MKLKLGEIYPATVIKFVRSGIIVKLPDKSSEFIHLSNISDQFVRNIADFVELGKCYQAQGVPGKARDVELSLKHLKLPASTETLLPSRNVSGSSPSKAAPSPRTAASLDDMISAANKVYDDKFGPRTRTAAKCPRRRSALRAHK